MELRARIDHAFATTEFPAKGDLVGKFFTDQDYIKEVVEDLEAWRGQTANNSLLRQMHQELRKLSANATKWIFPYYLKYALTEEAKYSLMETSFFILSLVSRSKEDDAAIKERISSMNKNQVECIADVLLHLNNDSDWSDYMGAEITKALATLNRLK